MRSFGDAVDTLTNTLFREGDTVFIVSGRYDGDLSIKCGEMKRTKMCHLLNLISNPENRLFHPKRRYRLLVKPK